MRYRVPPLISQLDTLNQEDPEKARKFVEGVALDFFASPAAQLLSQYLQTMYLGALADVTAGRDIDKAVGKMSAVNDIRAFFVSLLPEDESAKGTEVMDPELDESYLPPDSGFQVPYPEFNSGA